MSSSRSRPTPRSRPREFLCGLLELAEVVKPPTLAAKGGIWVRADALEIHLGVEADFRPAPKAHPGILVADLDRLAERLSGHGYAVDRDPELPGFRRFHTADTFGNRLEFFDSELVRGARGATGLPGGPRRAHRDDLSLIECSCAR